MRPRVFIRERPIKPYRSAIDRINYRGIAFSHKIPGINVTHTHARAQRSVYSPRTRRISFWRLSRQRARSFLIFVFIWHFHQASSLLSSPLASPSLSLQCREYVRGDRCTAADLATTPTSFSVAATTDDYTVRAKNRCRQHGQVSGD